MPTFFSFFTDSNFYLPTAYLQKKKENIHIPLLYSSFTRIFSGKFHNPYKFNLKSLLYPLKLLGIHRIMMTVKNITYL